MEQLVSQASGLIDYLLDAKNNGTFQGQKGDPGPQGEKGDPGEPTPQVLENTSRINSLETQMGDAAAALDAILALQNTLIGGAEA